MPVKNRKKSGKNLTQDLRVASGPVVRKPFIRKRNRENR